MVVGSVVTDSHHKGLGCGFWLGIGEEYTVARAEPVHAHGDMEAGLCVRVCACVCVCMSVIDKSVLLKSAPSNFNSTARWKRCAVTMLKHNLQLKKS